MEYAINSWTTDNYVPNCREFSSNCIASKAVREDFSLCDVDQLFLKAERSVLLKNEMIIIA